MFFPYRRISTLALALAPTTVSGNDYVVELLSPRFAEVQTPYGAAEPFVRPAAPFPYTNAWGHTFVLLLPVIAALAVRASRRTRLLLVLLVAAAVPPALATLNRGIAVGVVVILAYWGVRFFRRMTVRRLLEIAVAGVVIAGLVAASGVTARLTERTQVSSTTQDRFSLYIEAFQRTLGSPLLGWGAPRPSLNTPVSVGTQGHFWYLMFSHGFVGLGLFLGTIWGLAWITRGARSTEDLFLHTAVVVMSVTLLFYGVDPMHLVIVMSCGVLLMRAEVRTTNVPRMRRPATDAGRVS
jgi:hypothetical protein